ncbi:LLM class flavin-dependent oxidoreductase [Solwaraspora sp. WMMD792]|uniref:LLM class flavin-dependent oxidoreductase n=1 Tax=Solwaraspora sp. WMMD792 TaxID=3016099 RepID=UPI002416FFB2|nr:LLM class flavin-dependent oxidoreductase [Solwaraspora sp. WMMD792]MDG4773544.1 LLM class flavin-dependent oxidoreductase [Solwaraspora sp. WMMD792]
MADYGHDLLFGTFITPVAEQADRALALAQLTEEAGLDLVTVQDHPYQARFLDTWTLLSVIAARTTRVRVAPNVANLPLRQPAMLARSAASLDLLSGGRVELGLGAGAFWDAIAAMGGGRLTPAESVEALEEGIEIIRSVWDADGGTVKVDGRHHRVWGVHPGPAPAHPIGIWLGAYKKRMLGVTGRLADGWLPSSPYASPEQLPAMNAAIDAAARQAGRDPGAVRRLYNISGTFGSGDGFLTGTPADWAEQLAGLTLEQGFSGYLLASDDPDMIRRFAAEVVPAVRDLVAAGRSAAAAGSVPAASAAAAAGITPTPDDGVRLSAERVWDESTRPTAPPPDPTLTYSPAQRAAGQHLIDVHDHLREELRTVRDLIDQVAAGTMTAGGARAHINTMTMRQNNWTLGAYCESYCRVVTTHHTIEDIGMLPQLRRADPGLAPVVDRLSEEHHVIHDVLERVDRALVALVSEPDRIGDVKAAVDLLTDTLLSHLSYEERELVEPLARLGVG